MSNNLQTDLLNDAKIYGESLSKLPHDLYIPPDALEVYLDSFQGPLDLLLYLIRKNNIDILDIPMATLTTQYMEYVEKMKQIKLELAADYLLMSAMLIEIKSRMLLPPVSNDEEDDLDPRAELVKKLIEYELMKTASQELMTALLPIVDDLNRASKEFEKSKEKSLIEGMSLIKNKFSDVLNDHLFEIQIKLFFSLSIKFHCSVIYPTITIFHWSEKYHLSFFILRQICYSYEYFLT